MYLQIYFDLKVAPEKLRWVVGVIIAEGSEPIDDDLKYRLQIAGCKRHTLPCASMSVQTEVELTTKLSYHFVTKKVYPKLNDYIEVNGYFLCFVIITHHPTEGYPVRMQLPLSDITYGTGPRLSAYIVEWVYCNDI